MKLKSGLAILMENVERGLVPWAKSQYAKALPFWLVIATLDRQKYWAHSNVPLNQRTLLKMGPRCRTFLVQLFWYRNRSGYKFGPFLISFRKAGFFKQSSPWGEDTLRDFRFQKEKYFLMVQAFAISNFGLMNLRLRRLRRTSVHKEIASFFSSIWLGQRNVLKL